MRYVMTSDGLKGEYIEVKNNGYIYLSDDSTFKDKENGSVCIVSDIYKEKENLQISSIDARRLAFMFKINMNDIPPAYSKRNRKNERVNIIDKFDVIDYIKDNNIHQQVFVKLPKYIK